MTFFWIRTAGKTVERSDTRGHSLRQVLPHADHAFTSSFVLPRAARNCHISRLYLHSVCPAWAGPARPFWPRLAQSGTFNRSVLALPPALSLIDTLNIFYNPFQFLLTFFFSNFDLMQSGDYFHLHFSFLKDFESFAILNFLFFFHWTVRKFALSYWHQIENQNLQTAASVKFLRSAILQSCRSLYLFFIFRKKTVSALSVFLFNYFSNVWNFLISFRWVLIDYDKLW